MQVIDISTIWHWPYSLASQYPGSLHLQQQLRQFARWSLGKYSWAEKREIEPPMIPARLRPHAAPPDLSLTARTLLSLLFSGALVIGSFAWQGRHGFNIGDEGFLWYGAQRVLKGEVPFRDFMSYDPGRYYWSAAFMGVLRDNGILTLRYAAAVFQLIGLFVGLLVLLRGRSRNDAALFVMAAITLFVWMYPRHKLFDISLSIMLIGVLTLLVQQPSRRRFFFTGIFVGLTAVFGRNHGVYGLAGVLVIVAYLACRESNVRRLSLDLACCACGIVVGYLPVLIMIAAIPGFAIAFWESIRTMFERGTTNLPLPVPWPWLVPVKQLPLATAAADILIGFLFIAIVVFGVGSLLWMIRQALRQRPVGPVFAASSALALPYAQYAFSRADVDHLAQGIFPFLIGIFVVMQDWPGKARWILGPVAVCTSLLIMLPLHPGWDCRVTQQCLPADVAGSELKIDATTANILRVLKNLADQYAPNGRSFVVTPFWPGAYALLNRKSPLWEIYALFPRDNVFQQYEIERIEGAKPGLVIVLNVALDWREDLRFRNTHPLVDQFIRDKFDPMTVSGWPPETYQVYRSR